MLNGALRYTHFPYCLKRLESGGYVLLNRNYKPVGFMTGDWMNYEDYPVTVHIKGLTASVAAKLDHEGRDNLKAIYLYGDGCIPTDSAKDMNAYMGRLALLMTLKTETATEE